MSPRIRPAAYLVPGVSILFLVFSAPLAGQFPRVTYELQEGSRITDECVTCERMTLEFPISGSFVLERLPVRRPGELHEVSALELTCPDCPEGFEYSFRGEGSLDRRDSETLSLHLDLVLNGAGGVVLEGGPFDAQAPWPMIDTKVSEDGTRDPMHQLTLRILAAPRTELVPFELVKGSLEDGSGSFLEVVCPPCEIAHPIVPLEGTLLVGLVAPVDDGFSVYRLDQIHLKDLLPSAEYTIRGSGSYEEGGDAETLKQARLTVGVNDSYPREFRSKPVPVQPGAAFPGLDIEVEEVEKNTLWYRLHLVARGAGAYSFLRGDANADGQINIADPVYHLSWRFLGGAAPTCLEAADTDRDGIHTLTDAIFTLNYLFRDGPEPPAPGPSQCGPTPEARFSCDDYPAC